MGWNWGNAGAGAATGAAAGSVVPGLGTVAGGIYGGITGGMGGLGGNYGSKFDPTNPNGTGSKLVRDASGRLQQIDPTKTPHYNEVGYYSGEQSAGDINALMGALGRDASGELGKPVDTRDANRAAMLANVAQMETAQRNRSDQTAVNRGSGAYRSGGQGAALARIGMGADQMRIAGEQGIQNAYSQQQQAYDMQRSNLAQQQNLAALQAALANQQNRSQFVTGQKDRDYQANKVGPWQAKQDILGSVTNFGGNLLGQGLGFGMNMAGAKK